MIETALARVVDRSHSCKHFSSGIFYKLLNHPLSNSPLYFYSLNEQLTQLIGHKMNRELLCYEKTQGVALEEILSTSKHIAVLEDLVDVNNVGAVFRSAAALNVDAVILTAKCADNAQDEFCAFLWER